MSLAIIQTKAQNYTSTEANFIENLSNSSVVYSDTKFSESTNQYSTYNPVGEIKNLSDAIVKNYCRKYKLDYVRYYAPTLYIKEKYSLINSLNDHLKEHLAIFNKESMSSLLIAKVNFD
jgi:nucleoside-diphosphate-sugar epimerase